MGRLARSMLRLIVVVAMAAALLAASLGAVAFSTSRMVHVAATATEVRLPDLVTQSAVPSVIYAANGTVLATLRASLNRQPVALRQISPILISAVLDTEDHSFWIHGGMDVESAIRALFADVSAGSPVQGGSTIAQQLVKGIYLTDQKTLNRKIREAVLAERLEDKYTKAEILDAYLNTEYLGNGAYGVQAAAKEYFNRPASHLDLAQAALLAGLLQAPSGYDPLINPVGARQRRAQVLVRMVHYGSVTQAQAALANATPLPTSVRDAPGVSYTAYGYYVEQVVNGLLDNPALGVTSAERLSALFSGGLKIYTNERLPLEAEAEKVATADITSSGLQDVTAAFAVIDPRNGNVEALVGGPSGPGEQFDDATQGERQPGSGFKLFSLIGALEEGYDVYDSILAAAPCAIVFPGVPQANGYNLQHPLNNDPGDPDGVVSLVEATALSINCAFLRLAHEVGLKKVIKVARSMGVSDATLNPANPSLVIGTEAVKPIEMAAAYATVANGGIYHTPSFVNRVVDRTGAVIYDGETTGRRVFSAQIADEALVALRATVQYGTGTAAALPNVEAAGKTGTTSNSVDAWFNGVTPNLVASVWMGNPKKEEPMYYADGAEVYGAGTPTQIWHDVMAYALAHVTSSVFPEPNPSLMPSVKYIDSTALARDDLISHGYVPPPPTTTTTTTTTTIPGRSPKFNTIPTARSRGGPNGTGVTAPPASTTPPRTAPPTAVPVTTLPPATAPPPTVPTVTTRPPTTLATRPPTSPVTRPPTTPVTRTPTTRAPVPATRPPTTPATRPPTTPVTRPPTTRAPTTTVAPTTRPPTTPAPTTRATPPPTTPARTTTVPPTTRPPTTRPPTTRPPTTRPPTTRPPTTLPPTTLPPTTVAPTTRATTPPTTPPPTTLAPTTLAPTTVPAAATTVVPPTLPTPTTAVAVPTTTPLPTTAAAPLPTSTVPATTSPAVTTTATADGEQPPASAASEGPTLGEGT
jgi:penicillin-binding protein 1A